MNELEIRVGDVEAQLHVAELTVGEREYELRMVGAFCDGDMYIEYAAVLFSERS